MKSRLLRTVALPALIAVLATGCDDMSDPIGGSAAVSVSQNALAFETLDPDFGEGLPRSVTVTNTGGGSAELGGVFLEGAAASDFQLLDMPGMKSLRAGSSFDVRVVFDPSTAGAREAQLRIELGNGEDVVVPLSGRGQAAGFVQVDRMGIPALNTVFNHPPQFSKTDYNVATPDKDVGTYTGLFETVLGAVANPDPSGAAALLLPDALPVSLAGPTSFATLTGRALSDDAVDIALSVTVGIEALESDNVDGNDKAFSATFPYLARPHR